MFDNGYNISAGIADILGELEVFHLFMARARVQLLSADLDKLLRFVPVIGTTGGMSCGADQLGFGRDNTVRSRRQVSQVLSDISSGSQVLPVETLRTAQQQWAKVTGCRS